MEKELPCFIPVTLASRLNVCDEKRKMISFRGVFFPFLHTYSLSWSRVKALKATQKFSPNGGV